MGKDITFGTGRNGIQSFQLFQAAMKLLSGFELQNSCNVQNSICKLTKEVPTLHLENNVIVAKQLAFFSKWESYTNSEYEDESEYLFISFAHMIFF